MNLTLEVASSFYSSNDPNDPQGWSLRVEDDVSGTVLVDVQLGPEEFLTAMRGGVIHVTGRVANDLGRVGKQMRVWDQFVPREYEPGYNEPDTKAREWAEANSPEPFHTVEIRRQNNGVRAIYRVWEDI